MARSRQKITVGVSLVGLQDTAVEAHRPGTDGATVGVRVGAALIYICDTPTAQSFFSTWRSAGAKARRLPLQADPTKVLPGAGLSEPAVMMEAANCPPTWAVWDEPSRRLRVCVGRIVFDVADHGALRSVTSAFRHAAKVALVALPRPTSNDALAETARTAGRLFGQPGELVAGRERPRQLAPATAARRSARTSIERTFR